MGGGNRNSQSKAERRVERKARRKAEARQNHRAKEKIREKEIKEEKKLLPKKPKAWKRRDKDGSIILWNAIKLSKTSAYLLGVMGVIALLFVASPLFEDPNYVAPERYSFAECEAIEFEDLYCMYDFKWTREYADGGTISEYAEFDPFVDLPVLGDKYTEGEQDFLPPTDFEKDLSDTEWETVMENMTPNIIDNIGNFILFPVAYGEHDYLSGYSGHEKYIDTPTTPTPPPGTNTLNEFGLVFVEDELPEDKEELQELILQIRLDLDMVKEKLKEVELEVMSWTIDEAKLENDKFTADKTFEDAEDNLKDAERAYRHALDMKVRNNDDLLEQDAAISEYRIQVKLFDIAERELERALDIYNIGILEHRTNESLEDTLNEEMDELLLKLTEARIKLNLAYREYQFINVNLSKTCQMLIKQDLQTKCPTYREMIPLFDNTLPRISGAFVEVGYDLKRLPSPLQDHWNFYQQLTKTRVVSVDADTDLFDRGVNITIEARDFTRVEQSGATDKSESYNSSTLEQTIWHNIYVSDRCDQVSVGPDLKVIEAAILHVLNKCTTDLSEFKEVINKEPTVIVKEESAQWKYLKWVADLVASLRDDSNTK